VNLDTGAFATRRPSAIQLAADETAFGFVSAFGAANELIEGPRLDADSRLETVLVSADTSTRRKEKVSLGSSSLDNVTNQRPTINVLISIETLFR
jgi:hypothetical protein